ncbi:hypothetical protein FNJ62_21160 [Streptomyces benahoarensis]|uniref:Uncharacterized protein n=1 Tax=Streptomyces benahoarensis TaxID=2595054 RepID=A0A553YMN9_9ACTN|nr:hypothetical protein FNJ62_21160 [Streptomyces benahoarensis]TSB30450.1 hypothetical protein FNZ23_26160 [Streptomyces benahoarensis]
MRTRGRPPGSGGDALFPYLPRQPGCNKRLRSALPLVKRVIREPAMGSDFPVLPGPAPYLVRQAHLRRLREIPGPRGRHHDAGEGPFPCPLRSSCQQLS